MKFFTLKCTECGDHPLIAVDRAGDEVLLLFRSRELAQMYAAKIHNKHGEPPDVQEYEIVKI